LSRGSAGETRRAPSSAKEMKPRSKSRSYWGCPLFSPDLPDLAAAALKPDGFELHPNLAAPSLALEMARTMFALGASACIEGYVTSRLLEEAMGAAAEGRSRILGDFSCTWAVRRGGRLTGS
jgi:hypothetical protein